MVVGNRAKTFYAYFEINQKREREWEDKHSTNMYAYLENK